MESYLNNRVQFVEIETFRSSITHSLPVSSIQGSCLAGTFYTIYCLEVPLLHKLFDQPALLTGLIGYQLGHDATSQNLNNHSLTLQSQTHPCPSHPQASIANFIPANIPIINDPNTPQPIPPPPPRAFGLSKSDLRDLDKGAIEARYRSLQELTLNQVFHCLYDSVFYLEKKVWCS